MNELIHKINRIVSCSAFHRETPGITLKGRYYEDSDSKLLQRFLLGKES